MRKKFARIPLYGSLLNRGTSGTPSSSVGQFFQNCFPEVTVNPISGKRDVWLSKRKGITLATNAGLPSGFVGSLGAIAWTGKSDGTSPAILSYQKASTKDVRIWNATANSAVGSDIATVDQCNSLTETKISGTSNLVGIFENSTDALQECWYFPEGGAWTQVTDVDSPFGASLAVVGDPVHMDGYMFIMGANGKIWNSDLNSLANWTANSYIEAQSIPDNGVGIARHHDAIVAFGNYSIEFFRNTGNATGSPLSVVQDKYILIGALSKVDATYNKTIHSHEDDIYFLSSGSSESGDRAIHRLRNFQLEKVSTPYIEKIMAASATAITGIIGSFTMLGSSHIMFSGSSGPLCYCPEFNFWWLFSSSNGVPSSSCGRNIQSQFASSTTEYWWQVGSGNTDTGGSVSMIVQLDSSDFGSNNRKFFHKLSLIGDKLAQAGNTTISWSDDDFASFNSGATVDLSNDNPQINRLGTARKRSFKLTDTTNRPVRLKAIDLIYSEGSL